MTCHLGQTDGNYDYADLRFKHDKTVRRPIMARAKDGSCAFLFLCMELPALQQWEKH
jgi:hypothetical protein